MAPEIADVVAGELIGVGWGNQIRDRTIQRYTSVTDRNNSVPSPTEGDLAYIEDLNRIQVYTGSQWESVPLGTAYLPLAGGTLTGQLRIIPGANLAPGINFSNDSNTGLYRPGSDRVGFAAGGLLAAEIREGSPSSRDTAFILWDAGGQARYMWWVDSSTAARYMSLRAYNTGGQNIGDILRVDSGRRAVEFDPGSPSVPTITFIGDTNTGIYRPSSDHLGVAAAGILAALISAASAQFPSGSESEPGIGFHQDGDTGLRRASSNVLAVVAGGDDAAQFRDGGSGSSMWLQDGLTNVGNYSTLRLQRGTGSGLRAVGYYSSAITDPDTGAELKTDITALGDTDPGDPVDEGEHTWRPEWFNDLTPIQSRRRDVHDMTLDELRTLATSVDLEGRSTMTRAQLEDALKMFPTRNQIELGFSIEDLAKHTPLLTTDGDQVGGSPDEYALLAVTVDALQRALAKIDDLTGRITALEAVGSGT